MNIANNLHINDYDYSLPENRIAKYPVEKRDSSKLLLLQGNNVSSYNFFEIPGLLPQDTMLIFNNTKVIHARLLFTKNSGSIIEIFCLEPADNHTDIQLAFQQKKCCRWKCFIGNNKKWKEPFLIKNYKDDFLEFSIRAIRKECIDNSWIIEFSWDAEHLTFAEVIEKSGVMPLPPYIKREAEEDDNIRYQTIFANKDGSVAAPTAGLHFTDNVMKALKEKKVMLEELTLHVGAGTFKPVSSDKIAEHVMHSEKIYIDIDVVERIKNNLHKYIIPVGTTSTRTLESLYWFGVKLETKTENMQEFNVLQWDAYEEKYQIEISPEKSFENILKFMRNNNYSVLKGQTQLMIIPGYKFKVAKGIITNFHQPKSTLLLLISAMIGEKWKDVYQYALEHDFRFLSYGDSCLFLP